MVNEKLRHILLVASNSQIERRQVTRSDAEIGERPVDIHQDLDSFKVTVAGRPMQSRATVQVALVHQLGTARQYGVDVVCVAVQRSTMKSDAAAGILLPRLYLLL